MKGITWLAVFLVSLAPLALALEASVEGSAGANVESSNEGTTTETTANVEASASTEGSEKSKAEKRKDRHEERKEKREARKEARVEVMSVLKDVRGLSKATRQELKKHREDLKQARLDLKEELKTCKGEDSEECNAKRSEAKLAVKASLLTTAEEVTKYLESAKARVTESKLENKDQLVVDMDAKIAAVAEAKAKVEALSESSTSAEVREAVQGLRKALKEAKHSVRSGAHQVVAKKLGGVLEKSKHLNLRLEKALEKLKTRGVDTSKVDVAAFKAKVEAAAKLHAEAVALFEKAQTAEAGEKDELMKQATQKMQESHKVLKEAHALLKEILQELKALKGGSEALASVKVKTSVAASSEATTAETTTTASGEATAATS